MEKVTLGKQSLSRQFNAFFTFLAGEKKAAEEEGTPGNCFGIPRSWQAMDRQVREDSAL